MWTKIRESVLPPGMKLLTERVNRMRHFPVIRAGAFVIALILLALLDFSSPVSSSTTDVRLPGSSEITAASTAIVDDVSEPPAQSRGGNFTYYTVRPDLRRCASPMCGGFFVKQVNRTRTRCADGRNQRECYVAEINWNRQPSGEAQSMLLRGELTQRRFPQFGRLGVFRVTEAWRAASERTPQGTFFRVRDLGIRCITHPCLTHQEERLNAYSQRKIAGVELNGAGASEQTITEAHSAMTGAEGILVAGTHATVTGPAGRAQTLRATQFYLHNSGPVANKPCIKTGCGGQVCSDEEVISTCEWRPEYECYKRARCERQASGECGYTPTRELTACLSRR